MREKLKEEIKKLESKFPSDHVRLSVTAQRSLDEITVTFKQEKEEFIIQCNIPEDYPNDRPLWFSDSEDDTICQVLEELGSPDQVEENGLEQMVVHLTKRLCEEWNLQVPDEVEADPANIINEMDDRLDAEGSSEDEDLDALLDEVDPVESEEGISQEKLQRLEKIRMKQSQKSSIQATDRLMKEMKSIYKSESYKSGYYTVEPVDDNVYEWNVALLKVDPDSQLASDMSRLEKKQIDLSIRFSPDYPFSPPFIRVIAPVINGGYVLSGGAICMELLTNQGWSSAYSIESVIMQIGASLVKGKARIFNQKRPEEVYSLNKAMNNYKSLVQIHKNSGWYTPPKADG